MRRTDLRTSIDIAADSDHIFGLAVPIERWAELLPHYRWIKVRGECDGVRILKMSASRWIVPVSWQSVVTADSREPSIAFSHVGGFTKGMQVEWQFEPIPTHGDGGHHTRVTIVHHTDTMASGLRRWLTGWLVGPLFVDPIARRTLRRFKELAEST